MNAAVTSSLRLGVIGCGTIGRIHIANARRAGVNLAAVADPNQAVASAIASEHGIDRIYKEGAELLDDPNVDAVVLALPTCTRTRLAMLALKKGKHVLLEKPAAACADDLKKMREIKSRGIVAVASSRFRFLPMARVARDVVRAGELGTIRAIRCRAVIPAGAASPKPPPAWRLSKTLNGGGILMNWGVYDLDFLLGIVDFKVRPQTVLAQTWSIPQAYQDRAAPGSDAETHVAALVRCENGEVILFERGEFTTTRGEPAWEITGDRGSLRLSMTHGKNREVNLDLASNSCGIKSQILWSGDIAQETVHGLVLEDFVASVLDGRPPATGLAEAIMIHSIVDAIYASAASGKCAPIE